MLKQIRNIKANLHYIPWTLRLVWAAAPRWTLVWVTLLLLQGLLPVASVYMTRWLVDDLVRVLSIGRSWEHIQPVLVTAAMLAGVILMMDLVQSAIDWARSAQSEYVQDHITSLIHDKSVSVDLAFYESPDYYDHLHRARNEANARSLALLESGGSLLQNTITLLAMAAVLIPYGAWLPPVLLVSSLPALFIVLIFDRRYHQWWQETTPTRRWAQYYDLMLTHVSIAPELRIFGLAAPFISAYGKLRRRLRTEQLRLTKNQTLARVGVGVFALFVSGAVMVWMILRAAKGTATMGDLALFYQAFSRGQSLMHSLLSSLGKIYTNSLFLSNLHQFLSLKPQITDSPQPIALPSELRKGITFRDVSFQYPGSHRVALQNFNLSLPSGKITAVVGANGAGKSTLVKLLCRFYDPLAGRIELDGIDIRSLPIEELRRTITVLFQLPVPYHASAGENIALGDLSTKPEPYKIREAAMRAGAHDVISDLPQGYDTMLGKWFANGTDLSAGEWQRIALARAFLRSAPIMVLDEPTSFMDSWSEIDWFDRFRSLAEGRTAVVITHRFSLAMRADLIYVMHNGQVAESGRHHELLDQNGLYAQSWKAQMEACPVSPKDFPEGGGIC